MSVRYLYSTSGDYSAFVVDESLFNRSGEWIGYVENGLDVFAADGSYIGTISEDDRLLRDENQPPKFPSDLSPIPTSIASIPRPPQKRLKMQPAPPNFVDVLEKEVPKTRIELMERLFSSNLSRKQGKRLPDPPIFSNPRASALLVRGLNSWPDDATYLEIEQLLAKEQVQVTRFSYFGAGYSHYWPLDTMQSLSSSSRKLDDHISKLDSSKPIYLFGHSFGGLVIAHWILSHKSKDARRKLRELIDVVFLIATPLQFSAHNLLEVTQPITGQTLLMNLDDLPANISNLFVTFPRIVAFWAENDRFANVDQVGRMFTEEKSSQHPMEAFTIEDSNHFSVANAPKTIAEIVKLLANG